MNLREAFEKKNGNAFFEGREKITLNELVEEYPEGVNLTSIYIGNGANGPYIAFTTKEEPNRYAFGGKVMYEDVMQNWLVEHTVAEINAMLADMPCFVKFELKKGNNGRTYWDVL